MANSNYNVNLSFTADVSGAKAQLSSLQQSLTEISKASIVSPTTKWTPEIKEATQAALQLKHHLENATNVKTGTLDFTKLNDSVKKSGMSLTEYGRKLQSLGPEGQQAFMQLAGAIAQSEVPIKRVNKLLDSMLVTMKNTAKWQLSSSVLHGFMGALQSAYGYAQDLNKSLNDIRIVSGYGAEEMARFAKQANIAAKSLSTTTTEYTKASLIYYQQGDFSAEEIKERTDATVKMAQVAGQSVEETANQLTAVWNNFADGTKALEYYGDVITKLGAETAASTEEISAGLEKFVSIGETVGLSFEYATAAVTTIVDKTRASADTVGTALKTIFARLQGLQLGETLEDGVSLNKYSEALAKVGVQVLDTTGEMRKADEIIKDLGETWQTLSDSQQMALAQTVAGTRQYTQFISLMEHYDDFQANVSMAHGSSGTLDEQSETYAEGWEAARDRVQAAAEGIYDSLINDKFFITTLKGVEKLLGGIESVIDGLGGMRGVLLTLGVVATKLFEGKMAEGIRNFANNLKVSTESGRKQVEEEKISTLKTMGKDMAAGANLEGSRVGKIAAKQYEEQLSLQRQLLENQENMSEAEIAAAKQVLDIRSEIVKKVIEAAKTTEQTKNQTSDDYMKGMTEIYQSSANNNLDVETERDYVSYYRQYTKELKTNVTALNEVKNFANQYQGTLDDLGNKTKKTGELQYKLYKALRQTGMGTKEAGEKVLELGRAIAEADGDYGKITIAIAECSAELLKGNETIKKYLMDLGVSEETIEALTEDYNNLTEAERRELQIKMDAEMAQKRAEDNMKAQKQAVKDYADGIVAGAQALTSFVSVCSAAASIWETFNDPDLTGWEKFKQTLSGVGTMIMSLMSLMSSAAKAFEILSSGKAKDTVVNMLNLASEVLLAKAKENTEKASLDAAKAQDKETDEQKKDIVVDVAQNALEKGGKGGGKGGAAAGKGAAGGIKGAASGLGKSAGAYIQSIGPVLAQAAVIAAAVAIAAAAIYGGVKAMNTAEDNFKEASTTATDLANSAQHARSELEELKSAFDSLDSKKDALAGLTEGTAEYTAALQESNAAVLDLINSNDSLSMADLEVDEKGVYSISQEAKDRVLEEKMDKAGLAQSANLKAQARRDDASQNMEVDSFLEEQNKGNTIGTAIVSGLAMGGAGAVTGAAVGSMVPAIGTAVGAVAGAIAGAGVGVGMALKEAGEGIDKKAASFDSIDFSSIDDPTEKLKLAAEALGLDFDSLDNSMKEEINALIANKEATDKNTAALLREATKASFDEEFKDLTETEKNLASDSISKDIDKTSANVKAQLDKRWEGKLNGSELDEAAAMLGYEEGTEIKAIKGDDGVTRYTAVNAAGETLEELGTVDAITSRVAEEYANKAAKGEDMKQYESEDAQNALGDKTVDDFTKDTGIVYEKGKNYGEEAAKNFDFNLEGTAEQMLNDGVAGDKITVKDFQDENGKFDVNKKNQITEGIEAVANASGKLDEEEYKKNADAINAYYKALFGEDIDENNVNDALDKLNKIKKTSEVAAKEAEEKEIDSIGSSAVSEGLVESTEAFEAYRDAMIDANTQEKLGKKASAELAKQMLKNQKAINKAAEGWEEYNEAIENSDEIGKANALGKIASALNEVFGEDVWDGKKIEEHKDIVEKALKGEAGAFNKLQAISASEIIGEFGEVPKELTTILTEIANLDTVEVGDKVVVGEDPVASKLQSMYYEAAQAALEGGKSVEEAMRIANDAINAVGYEAPEIEMEEKTVWVTTDLPVGAVPQADGSFVGANGEELKGYSWTEKKPNPATATHQVKMLVPKNKKGSPMSFTKTSEKISPGNSGKNNGGGGGGSKSKPAEKVKKTKKSDVVERYKEINDALDDMADAIDKVSGKADRLYGAARIKAMKDQAKLMRQEVDLLKKKRAEAEKNKKADKEALELAAKEAGLKKNPKTNTYFNYDDKGNITDYTSEMEKLYKELNAAETKMNGMSTKEQQDEYKDKVIDDIQDRIDLLTDAISQYEETRELIEDLDKEIMEGEWAAEDLEFEAFQYEIELKIEVDDRDLQYLEYLLGKIEDKAFAAAERIGNLTEQADLLMSKAETSQGAIDKILGDNLSKADKKLFDQGKLDQIDWQSYIDNETFTEAEVEELLKQADELLAYNEELFALSDQVHEELQNSFAEWNEEVEKGIALFDHYDSVVDHLQNITDLTQGLTGYNAELNRNLAETKTQLASDRAASYAQVYSDQKDVADTMRNKMYNEDGTETEWFSSLSESEQEQWIKDLEVAEESVREAEENLFASTSEAIQAAIDEFEVAFTSSLKEMELALAGEGGFAAWNTALERQQDISERTLKTYQETYELSKLNRQVINSINDTDNVKAKQALLEIQEEIYQYQKDGKEMSQYELDYLQKKYELRLAEIALEEAQNAKSQVRMSRDGEGNWGYVYTADEDKVAEAEQNYEDKLYEITNLTQEYQDQVSANIIQTYQEFNDAMQEIYDRNAEGLYSSEEEFLNAIAETQAFYQGKLDFQYEQLDIATANSKALYEEDWTSYEFSTNAKINSNKGFQNSFDTTMAGVATGYQNSEKALSEFSGKVGTVNPKTGTGTGLLGGIAQAYNNMQTSVNNNLGNISKAMGMKEGVSLDLKNFSENASKYLTNDKTGVTAKSKKTADQIKTDSKNIKKYLIGEDGKGGLLKSVSQFSDKWKKYIQDIIDKNEKLVKSINALNKALTEDKPKKPKDPKDDEPKDPKDNEPKSTQGDGKIQVGDKVKYKSGKYTGDSYGSGGSGDLHQGEQVYVTSIVSGKGRTRLYHISTGKKLGSGDLGWVEKSQISGYDTGGYTGEWGKEGKLAFLHQKELILNQDDTKNFLLAMNVLREITKAITLQSVVPDASKFNFGGKNVVEQDVTIHAEFPNVTDHNEIEMALSNLVNTASQYANRK